MKLIEALKKVKYLQKKADDIKEKIGKHSADLDYETPVYADQRSQVTSWIQGYTDILKDISHLQYAIQKTNLEKQVKIKLGDNVVEKSITEWILRRRTLAKQELSMYKMLTDKNLREGNVQFSGGQVVPAKIRRYYDPVERDKKLEELTTEPHEIDATLEIVNATTDLID